MKTAQQITKEIDHFKNEIASLENRLKEIQLVCDHHFNGDEYFRKCKKCEYVEVLYY